MISFDSETTGIDFKHGARPFFVTTCTSEGVAFWEWDVDPLTRMPVIPPGDLAEIWDRVQSNVGDCGGNPCMGGGLILQNSKFDFAAMLSIGFWDHAMIDWAWARMRDTLLAGHLLASNHPHNLTDMGIEYLGIDIEPYEIKLKEACNEARRWVRSNRPDWMIAKEGLPCMPSAGEKCWKYDTWLPRAVAMDRGDPEDHPWHTVLKTYANADSAVTLTMWEVMRKRLLDRELDRIYETRLKVMPIAYDMETHVGVSGSLARLEEKEAEYQEESANHGQVCLNIATSLGYDLQMPKGASPNGSLRLFMFDILKVPHIHSKKSRTDAPTLDKAAMAHYKATLPPEGKAHAFVRNLLAKRGYDTALAYMKGYRQFWIPVDVDEGVAAQHGAGWWKLYPSLNPTGTDTMRWSSSNPNEQNISKREDYNVRYCFGPLPGYEWWSLDAKNIELRLPFYKSGEQELIDLFEHPDDPPYYGSNHLLNFHTVYPDIWDAGVAEVGIDKVGPYVKKKYASTWYQWDKNGGFALQYQAGRATADAAFHRAGSFDRMKSRFKRLDALNMECVRFAERHGYIETMPDKTVDPERGYPLLCTRTEYGKILGTVPLSYYIQGTAMWWTMKAMFRVDAKCREWRARGFDARMVMQVHDELVVSMPAWGDPRKDLERERKPGGAKFRTSNLWRVRELQRLMALGGDDLGVPTPVGAEWHADNWGEGVTM